MPQYHYYAAILFGCTRGCIGEQEYTGPGKRKYFMRPGCIEYDAVLTPYFIEPGFCILYFTRSEGRRRCYVERGECSYSKGCRTSGQCS